MSMFVSAKEQSSQIELELTVMKGEEQQLHQHNEEEEEPAWLEVSERAEWRRQLARSVLLKLRGGKEADLDDSLGAELDAELEQMAESLQQERSDSSKAPTSSCWFPSLLTR